MAVRVVKLLYKCFLISCPIFCAHIFVSLTNRRQRELIHMPKYFCVKDESQTRLTYSLLLITEGKLSSLSNDLLINQL